MKLISLLCMVSLFSCNFDKGLNFEVSKIERVELYSTYPSAELVLKAGIKDSLLADLTNLKTIGPRKYHNTHRLMIYHEGAAIDTIATNGTICRYQKHYYRSEINLIEKYMLIDQQD